MWERQAVRWWQTTDGGELSHEEAQEKWNETKRTYRESKIPYDHGGPKKSPFRMRVGTRDLLNYASEESREKEAEIRERPSNKYTQPDVDTAVARARSNHDMALGGRLGTLQGAGARMGGLVDLQAVKPLMPPTWR